VARIDTRGEGIPLIVFNPTGAPRTDAVNAGVGCSVAGMNSMRVVAPDGTDVPVQLVDAQRCPDGSLVHAQIAFVARDVPALGYAVYRVLPQAAPHAPAETGGAPVLENEFYRVTVDAATGAITGLKVKDGNWEVLRAPGNVVAMEQDGGDFWELYKALDGASRIAMADRHPAPAPGQATLSTDQAAGQPAAVTRGPVFSEVTVAHPFSANGRFQTRVRLYRGLRRIEVRTTILNQDAAVRYRVLFPTTIAAGENVHEIPFGALARPDGVEFPAQNWVDWSDGRHGVALLNRGLPGNNTADGTLLLSLLRSTQIVAYAIYGGYEGQSSATGLELGQERVFDYALVPHAGDWRQAAQWAEGQAFNQPLLAVAAAPHPGPLPARWGFLTLSQPNVVLSALKPGEHGGAVLRVYEAAGLAAEALRLELPAAVRAAQEVNLMEDPLQPLPLVQGALRLDLRPFEIKTIGLQFRRAHTE
jgi:alpha-mannosidase